VDARLWTVVVLWHSLDSQLQVTDIFPSRAGELLRVGLLGQDQRITSIKTNGVGGCVIPKRSLCGRRGELKTLAKLITS
jgi:hypothetical protein